MLTTFLTFASASVTYKQIYKKKKGGAGRPIRQLEYPPLLIQRLFCTVLEDLNLTL